MPVFEGYRRFCAVSPKRRDVQDAIDSAEDRTASPYDTHPSLVERLAALGGDYGRAPQSACCVGLLGGEDRIDKIA